MISPKAMAVVKCKPHPQWREQEPVPKGGSARCCGQQRRADRRRDRRQHVDDVDQRRARRRCADRRRHRRAPPPPHRRRHRPARRRSSARTDRPDRSTTSDHRVGALLQNPPLRCRAAPVAARTRCSAHTVKSTARWPACRDRHRPAGRPARRRSTRRRGAAATARPPGSRSCCGLARPTCSTALAIRSSSEEK